MIPFITDHGHWLTAHFSSLDRMYDTVPRLHTLGHFPSKTSWIDQIWYERNVSISFVTEGAGRLEYGKQGWDLAAPFIIVEYPGDHYRYGPSTAWKEFFFTYDTTAEKFRSRWKIAGSAPPWWPMANMPAVLAIIKEMQELCPHADRRGVTDRIDQLAEQAILLSMTGRLAHDEGHRRLHAVEEYFRLHFSKQVNIGRLAEDHGFSVANFRRYWSKEFTVSPNRFITGLRLDFAARMLAESQENLKSIARRAGFRNMSHFSRKFSERFGLSPSECRGPEGIESSALRTVSMLSRTRVRYPHK